MNTWKLVIRNLRHYRNKDLTVILGIAISAAVLTGALIVGDSVTSNLKRISDLRLGNVSYTLNSGDRFITCLLAPKIQNELNVTVAPLLSLEGMAVSDGGRKRVNKVQILGIDPAFDKVMADNSFYKVIPQDEVIISRNLADRLDVKIGDEILFRIKKAGLIPLNAPFVSDEELVISERLKIKAIAGDDQYGKFNLRISQTSPFSAFLSIESLNRLMNFKNKANVLLIASNSSVSEKSVLNAVRKNWSVADAGLIIREIPLSGEIEVLSERVFLDRPVLDAVNRINGPKNLILTYFVNSLSSKSKSSPYSFVSTLPDSLIGFNEIIINQWLAEDQNIKAGDSLKLKYYTVGPLRRLTESETDFVIKDIVSIKGFYADRNLMPLIPGLSDAGNCRDWKTGVPVNLEKIRDKDEKYWDDFKGTPKAFIAQSKARELWENSFGSYTSVRFGRNQVSIDNLARRISENLDPYSLGFQINSVRKDSQSAVVQGVDFSGLFFGLSFFVLLAAAILSVLLMILNLEGRREQLETLSALGIPNRIISAVMYLEGLILSVIGGVSGLVLSLVYTRLIFAALNGVWIDIVRTDQMQMYISIPALATGFLLSTAISWITLFFTIRKFLVVKHRKFRDMLSNHYGKIRYVIAGISGITSIGLIISQIIDLETINAGIFFLAGGLMLLAMLLIFYQFLVGTGIRIYREMNLLVLGIKNGVRNKSRSTSIVALLSLGTFIVLSTGANRKNLFLEASDKSSGTGGFLFFSESTVAVIHDLNNSSVRQESGLTSDVHFVQFSKAEGDDASCLNLNRVTHPQIFGVDPKELEGRFGFVSGTSFLNESNPWSSLDQDLPDKIVPAIADETVIKWGLGKKVGDTLVYTDGTGSIMKLLLIGGLDNSVFQGNVIISDKQFLAHYPDKAGSNVFLIDGATANQANIEDELRSLFRDYGWEMQAAVKRLAEFNSVENTYLSIFLVLGALAILIGTAGLGVILARSILERRKEIALMKAVGIGQGKILRLFLNEYLLMLFSGIVIGGITSTIATLPALLNPIKEISLISIWMITGILLLNGLFWIFFLARIYLRDPEINAALRNE